MTATNDTALAAYVAAHAAAAELLEDIAEAHIDSPFTFAFEIEITASANVNVPSRLPPDSIPVSGMNREAVVETGLSLERTAAETRALELPCEPKHPGD